MSFLVKVILDLKNIHYFFWLANKGTQCLLLHKGFQIQGFYVLYSHYLKKFLAELNKVLEIIMNIQK